MVHSHEFARDGYPEPPSQSAEDDCACRDRSGSRHDLCQRAASPRAGRCPCGPSDLLWARQFHLGRHPGVPALGDVAAEIAISMAIGLRSAGARDRGRPECGRPMPAISRIRKCSRRCCRLSGSMAVSSRRCCIRSISVYGEPLTRSGIPRLAGREQADRILARVRDVSAEFGCVHEIEDRRRRRRPARSRVSCAADRPAPRSSRSRPLLPPPASARSRRGTIPARGHRSGR